ncbi:Complement component C6 [Dirofilaria immitis]|nr:Complement component C6 [Dirofilaria immitis]
MRTYAKRSALLEPIAVQPPDSVYDDDTLKKDLKQRKANLLRKFLSDLTDKEDDGHYYTRLYSMKLIIPLLKDPRVWSLTVVNFMTKISNREQPCLYQWSEWGPCSETCLSSSRLPSRSRHILKTSIIQARGRFPSCPNNLETMVEHMPCNVYRCPVSLSSITNWTQCVYKDPNILGAGGCYRMRDLPTTNQLIYVDTDDIIRDCKCPDHIL